MFQMLTLSLYGNVRFYSEPPEYVEDVFTPILSSEVNCNGRICDFPYGRTQYFKTMGCCFLGAVLLCQLSVFLVVFFSYPTGFVAALRSKMALMGKNILGCCAQKLKSNENGDKVGAEVPYEEVVAESKLVEELVQPLLVDGALVMNSRQRESLPPVVLHKLQKVYPAAGGLPPKVALDCLDLHVPNGQVLGLLGKNGAGKTTTLKILSSTHDSTGGIALASGFNVATEKIAVFERLGNCPQFDIIWTDVTVRAHLEYFARLKGLPKDKVAVVASNMASVVGLGSAEVFNRNAGALSGGMRRRLSIAISLIGAPAVLLLDEPTTGLDPSTRNSIWELLSSFSTEERAIIITTHMMIEADTLCNRIAIMSNGRLNVVATQQALKDRFGSGYVLQLNLIQSSKKNIKRAMAYVKERLHPDAVLQTKQAKTLQVALPRDLELEKVFLALYSPETSAIGGINQFLLSQSSLEDVFVALSTDSVQ